MKSAPHISLVLILVVILLLIEEIFAQDPSKVELVIEMPQHIVRQGTFHGSVCILFKEESSEVLKVVSIKILHREELLFESSVSRNLSGIKNQWDEYQNFLFEYKYLIGVGGKKEDTDILKDRLLDLQSEISQGMEIQIFAIDSYQLFRNSMCMVSVFVETSLIRKECDMGYFIIRDLEFQIEGLVFIESYICQRYIYIAHGEVT